MDNILKVGIFATAVSALALGGPAIAAPVTLKSDDGVISLDGTLLEHEGDVYVIDTGLGVMRINKELVACEGAGCPVPEAPPAPAVVVEVAPAPAAPAPLTSVVRSASSFDGAPITPGAPVQLTSADGLISLTGVLETYEGDTFVIKTQLGTMRIAKALVACDGDGCPQDAVPAIFVRGSETIGEDLMPSLVRGYAELAGGVIATTEDLGNATTRLGVVSSQGSGTAFDVEIGTQGSSTGLRALIASEADIAMASRVARATEIRAISAQGRGNLNSLEQHYVIAVDSILTVVNPSNPIDALSTGQLAGIFSGSIQNWSAVGGPDLPITVYTKGESSGTREVFTQRMLTPRGVDLRPDAIAVSNSAEMSASVQANPGAIGYIDYAGVDGAKSLDLIASCGIRMTASEFSAKTGEYPLERRLHLYIDNAPLAPEAQGLLNFAVSTAADPLIRDAGFIDLGVKVASRAATAQRQLADEDAQLGREELTTVGTMLKTLEGAERLSTTLRFELNSETLDDKSQRDILRLIEFMKDPQMAGRELILAGFSDSTGAFGQNQTLSARRAAAALAALQSHPMASALQSVKVTSAGFSELSPVGCNTTEDGRQRNRRVELWLK